MRPRLLAGLVAAALSVATFARSDGSIPLYDATQIDSVCNATLERATAQIKTIERVPPAKASVVNVLHAWNRLLILIEDAASVLSLYADVHPQIAVRDAADRCLLQLRPFATGLYQNAKLYRLIERVPARAAYARKLRQDLLDDFFDAGVSLPAAARQRVKTLLEQQEILRQAFDRNIRDVDTRLAFSAEEMRGPPPAFIESAQRDAQSNFLLGFDYTDYYPFMENAHDEAARKRYFIAFNRRGGERNLQLLDQITQGRAELARLFGRASYAEFALRRRMVGSLSSLTQFLAQVSGAVSERERKMLVELRQAKAAAHGKSIDQVELQRWDIAYYEEQLKRQRFNVNQEALRAYFPIVEAVELIMLISSRLYSLEYKAVSVPVWHSEVRHFEVLDRESARLIGHVYLDLFPRDGKYKHAAAWQVRGGSTLAKRAPVSVLVANMNRKGLNLEEMETLLHEFGHVLHNLLSTTRYNAHAGTNVVRDFVEAPAQMFEYWARRPEALKLMANVCSGCPIMDDDLIERLNAARRFTNGMNYARQHLYAAFDLALTGPQPAPAMQTWKQMESATPLGHVDGTLFPASFSHIVGDYAAGYYGYLWSEVVALDMLSAFGANVMDPAVGRRFRDTVLAEGGQRAPQDLVRRFLGRPVSERAFFTEIAAMAH